MRVALAQINTTVGDLAGNERRVRAAYEEARNLKADLVVFPELTTTGYPPRDLLLQSKFSPILFLCLGLSDRFP